MEAGSCWFDNKCSGYVPYKIEPKLMKRCRPEKIDMTLLCRMQMGIASEL